MKMSTTILLISREIPGTFHPLSFTMAAHAHKRLQLSLSFMTRLIVTVVGGLPVCRCVSGNGAVILHTTVKHP